MSEGNAKFAHSKIHGLPETEKRWRWLKHFSLRLAFGLLFLEVVGRSVNPPIRYRPIIQDTSGRIANTSPEPETIEPGLNRRVQSNAGSTRSARR